MRQPKFRGVSKETNKWIYGFGWFETDYTETYLQELEQTKQDAANSLINIIEDSTKFYYTMLDVAHAVAAKMK